MENQKYGMGWLTLYTILFGIRIVGGCFAVAYGLFNVIKYFDSINATYLLIVLYVIIETGYIIFTFIHFDNKTDLGYTLNIVYLFLGVVISGFDYNLTRYLDPDETSTYIVSSVISTIFIMLIWSLPNYVYFKHRRFLFSGTLKEKKNEKNQKTAVESEEKEIPIGSSNADISNNEIPTDLLKKLNALYKEGVFSEEEYNEKKKQLLKI